MIVALIIGFILGYGVHGLIHAYTNHQLARKNAYLSNHDKRL